MLKETEEDWGWVKVLDEVGRPFWSHTPTGRTQYQHLSLCWIEEKEEEEGEGVVEEVTVKVLFIMSLHSLLIRGGTWLHGAYAEVTGYHTLLRFARLAPAVCKISRPSRRLWR